MNATWASLVTVIVGWGGAVDAAPRRASPIQPAEADDELHQLLAARDARPDDPAANWDLGLALFDRGKLGDADDAFRRAEEHSDHPYPTFMRGAVAELDLRFEDALRAYRRSLELDPSYARAQGAIDQLEAYLADLERFRRASAKLDRDLVIVIVGAGALVALIWRMRRR